MDCEFYEHLNLMRSCGATTESVDLLIIKMGSNPMSDCIEHPGYIGKNGYGQKKYRGKVVAAHRLAYALANGLDVFTMGGSVLHSCDNPVCVNPKHLRLGTHVENMQDRAERDRCASKLAIVDAEYIRANVVVGTRWSPGNVQELATKFGVHRKTIMDVVNGVSQVGV